MAGADDGDDRGHHGGGGDGAKQQSAHWNFTPAPTRVTRAPMMVIAALPVLIFLTRFITYLR